MIQTNCSKCGADLILHDGYGVCNKCGEIVAFDVAEETKEEILETEITEEIEAIEEETISEDIKETFEEPETEEKPEITETVEEETKQEVQPKMPEVEDAPKKRGIPLIILIIVILCALAVLAGFILSGLYSEKKADRTDEIAPVSDTIEENTPEEFFTEEEIPEITEETTPEKVKPATPPAPVTEKEPVKSEKTVITEAPAIAYRIRKSADDSTTQIGAFSDLERAKAFAQRYAEDGYMVFDMYGNLVFEP